MAGRKKAIEVMETVEAIAEVGEAAAELMDQAKPEVATKVRTVASVLRRIGAHAIKQRGRNRGGRRMQ